MSKLRKLLKGRSSVPKKVASILLRDTLCLNLLTGYSSTSALLYLKETFLLPWDTLPNLSYECVGFNDLSQ